MIGMFRMCFVGLSMSGPCESKVWLVRLLFNVLMLGRLALLHEVAGACLSSVAAVKLPLT